MTRRPPQYGKRFRVRTWYGAVGQVELHGPFWHLVGLWGLDVPHPPLVNLLVRLGLPLEAKRELSFKHEAGHLQTLPVALLMTALLLVRAWRSRSITWRSLPLLWAGHHAMWEMLAEGYVMWSNRDRYRRLYGDKPHLGLMLFWLLTAILVGWSVRDTGNTTAVG